MLKSTVRSTLLCSLFSLLALAACESETEPSSTSGSTENGTGGSSVSGTGGSSVNGTGGTASGDICDVIGPGCLTVKVDSEFNNKTCVEISADIEPTNFESDCVNNPDPAETGTYLPGGCPRDDDMACGLLSVVDGVGSGIGFLYLTGNATADAYLCTSCDAQPENCCHGPAYQ